MRVPLYDVRAQYEELQAPLDAVVHEVISSGAYVLGQHHHALEAEIASLHGVKHAVAVNSGTDALRIALDAADIGAGDEVITTAFTFVASVEAIVQTGARPVFVDIDPETYCLNPEEVEKAITPRTKAIMPVHLFGQLASVAKLREIADNHRLLILEDAAQAIASKYEGVYTGHFGFAATLSFYVTKNLGAAGDGGMILTNEDRVAERARSMRIHGMGRERYYYDELGYTSRLDEIQAAILRVKLTRLQAWNERRVALAALYREGLEGSGIQAPVVAPGNNHTYHQYTIATLRRDALMAGLKEKGVDSAVYYPVPLHFHKPYERFAEGPGSLPITERLSGEVLSLPIHPHLSDEQVRYAASCIRELSAATARS